MVGFQRELDEKRAEEIASYIDNGLGTIPSSIVLSAQEIANLKYSSSSKSISFVPDARAFLILDGQHRVYGFKKVKTDLRVPVVIYTGLSRRDETRLFIDINSKQRGVPPELLLDIKRLAEYENDEEEVLRAIFDTFNSESDSILLGKLSPSKKTSNKLSRAVFNRSLKPLLSVLGNKNATESYRILNAYFIAFDKGVLRVVSATEMLSKPTPFRAFCAFMPQIASRVKDRHGADYTVDNFYSVLSPVGERVKKTKIESTGQAYKPIVEHLEHCLSSSFTL